MLTIAIPTYNRNELLFRCLEKLLLQITDNQRLLVVDNCSDIPVEKFLKERFVESDLKKVRFVRNLVNVGGAANLLRCLELCETKWLYCLGDDDIVADDCIQKIETNLNNYPEALYISFSRGVSSRPHATQSEGMKDFIRSLDDWSSFLFMSASVINAKRMRLATRWGYLYAYTWAPFQAILLKLLNAGGQVVFTNDIICSEESCSDSTWIPFPVAAGKMLLPELVDNKALKQALAIRLMAKPGILALIYLARVLSDSSMILNKNHELIQIYLARCARYIGSFRWVQIQVIRCFAFIVLNPYITPKFLFRWIASIGLFVTNRKDLLIKSTSDDRT